VCAKLSEFFVEVPHTGNDHHNDAIKKAFEKGVKFVLCVGPTEVKNGTVSVEGRQPMGSKEKVCAFFVVAKNAKIVPDDG